MLMHTVNALYLTGDFKLEIQPKQNINIDNIPSQIEREHKKLDRIKDAYENEVYTLDEFKKSRQQILDKISELEQKLSETEIPDEQAELIKLQKKVIDILPALRSPAVPEESKNLLLKAFIKRIVFYRSMCNIDIFFYA